MKACLLSSAFGEVISVDSVSLHSKARVEKPCQEWHWWPGEGGVFSTFKVNLNFSTWQGACSSINTLIPKDPELPVHLITLGQLSWKSVFDRNSDKSQHNHSAFSWRPEQQQWGFYANSTHNPMLIYFIKLKQMLLSDPRDLRSPLGPCGRLESV